MKRTEGRAKKNNLTSDQCPRRAALILARLYGAAIGYFNRSHMQRETERINEGKANRSKRAFYSRATAQVRFVWLDLSNKRQKENQSLTGKK